MTSYRRIELWLNADLIFLFNLILKLLIQARVLKGFLLAPGQYGEVSKRMGYFFPSSQGYLDKIVGLLFAFFPNETF